MKFNINNSKLEDYSFQNFCEENNLNIPSYDDKDNFLKLFNIYKSLFYNPETLERGYDKFKEWFENNNIEIDYNNDNLITFTKNCQVDIELLKFNNYHKIYELFVNFKDHSTKSIQFKYLNDNWYEENDIYYAIDYDQYSDLHGDANGVVTYKCPQKILDKCIHITKKIGKFQYLLYNKYAIIIYYKTKNGFNKDIKKFKWLRYWLMKKYRIKLWYGVIKQ